MRSAGIALLAKMRGPMLSPHGAPSPVIVAAVVAPSAVAGLSPYSGDAELVAFYTEHTSPW